MAEYQDREHYIPLRKSDLVALLCANAGLAAGAAESFRQLCDLLSATFHFEYHKLLEELKDAYAPFDPDAVTRPVRPATAADRGELLDNLYRRLGFLMERANFKHLSREQLVEATRHTSDWGLPMDVDFDLF